jgi:site-specific DNA recombinase
VVLYAQSLCNCNDAGIPAPKKYRYWDASHISKTLQNPVYKGEFIAHRWIHIKIQKPSKDGLSMRTVWSRLERPEDEWIRVSVPAIVDAGLWQLANDMLAKNKAMARRNAKEPYLLTGLIRCATCGYSYVGITKRYNSGNVRVFRSYRCDNCKSRPRYLRIAPPCRQGSISTLTLDQAVWGVVCTAPLEPQVLISALEADMLGEQNVELDHQIAYVEGEINGKQAADDRLYKAYMAGAFDETEYAEGRAQLKDERALLESELERLRPLRATREEFEAQRALILDFAERVRSLHAHVDPPFEVKQRIIKMTVNRIVLNVQEGVFHLEGAIRRTYPFVSSPIYTDKPPSEWSGRARRAAADKPRWW